MPATPLSLPVVGGPVESVSAALHAPTRATGPAALLVPGAGGDLHGAGLVALAETLAELGCTVVRANLPYREAGRRAPRADASVQPFLQVLAAARAEVAPARGWIAGGKSYGGRVASLACASEQVDLLGLVFYGYPLHPPGKPEQPRTAHWHDVRVPTLFLQGSHDAFGTPAELEPHLAKLPRRATLLAVEGGDHSLDVAGTRAPDGVRRAAPEVLAGLAGPVADWLRTLED